MTMLTACRIGARQSMVAMIEFTNGGMVIGFLIYVPFVKAANKLDPELTVPEPPMKKAKTVADGRNDDRNLEGDAI